MAPSTPTRSRSRLAAPSSSSNEFPTSTPTRSPAAAAAAAVARRTTGKQAQASPQVKAALALLRSQQRASAAQPPRSSSSSTLAEDQDQDPFSTPSRIKIEPSTPGVGQSITHTPQGERVLLDWGGKSEVECLREGGRSGHLNLSSRSLTRVPGRVYSTLLALGSSWHPSHHRRRSSSTSDSDTDTDAEDEDPLGLGWDEQQELRSINLANNELIQLEERVGGFQELQVLDLRTNHLPSLPLSLSLLHSLTTLTLSHNRLTHFPTQILALPSLVKLDLSHNFLAQLWWGNPKGWREELQEIESKLHLREGASPSRTPESKGVTPLSRHPHSHLNQDLSSPPLPALKTLLLAHNPHLSLALAEELSLPPNLTTLDLSHTLCSSIPLQLVGRMEKLERLGLESVGAGDEVFSLSSAENEEEECPPLFPSLKRLELAGNRIESLQGLEGLFEGVGNIGSAKRRRRKVKWEGLGQREVRNLILAEEGRWRSEEDQEDEGMMMLLEVDLRGNPLGKERARRRARWEEGEIRKRKSIEEQGMVRAVGKLQIEGKGVQERSFAEEKKVQQREEPAEGEDAPPPPYEDEGEEEEGARTPSPASPTPTPSAAAPAVAVSHPAESVRVDQDPLLPLLLAHLPSASTKPTLSLPSLSLPYLPLPPPSPPPFTCTPNDLNLSRNHLTSLPSLLPSLEAWGWSSKLVRLDLSWNRFQSLDLDLDGSVLRALRTLDVSHNPLGSSSSSSSSLKELAKGLGKWAPGLRILKAEYCSFTSLEGVESLLLLLPSSPEPEGEGGVRLKELHLKGNKVAEVEPLLEVGKRLEERGLGGEKGGGGGSEWCLELLDLRDNEIARLPPSLGLLPHSLEIHLLGNRFRIPRLEVYENAAKREVLPWLWERM